MKKNIVILILAGIITLGLVWWLTGHHTDESKQALPAHTTVSTMPQIEFVTVQTERKSVGIPIDGRLKAENRLEIFPEVQGKIKSAEKPFREGVTFQKGEPLMHLESDETRMQLISSRSSFRTLIASLMPDLIMDYPSVHPQFEKWLDEMKPEQVLLPVPETGNSRIQRFLSARGVFDRYYQIKSAEQNLQKFIIKAPFTGIVSASNAEPGQTVSPQHHLGTLVDPNQYRLTASVQQSEAADIEAGTEVILSNHGGTRKWSGVISRVNPSVSNSSQMVEIYVDVSGDGLREGMYLKGIYFTGKEQELARIPKSALLRTGHVYARKDSVIREIAVEIAGLKGDFVEVTGLRDGDVLVRDASRALSGLIIQ